jgi:ornithine decarboxylase
MPPILYLDPARARADYTALATSVRPIRLRYATKANSHPALLAALADADVHFAVMSRPELDALLALGIPGERIACVTPGPPASLLRRCHQASVRRLAVDSVWELRKVAALVPGAHVTLALRVGPWGRLIYPQTPLGLPLDALDPLLAAARPLPVHLDGVAVHVGSQCERLYPWTRAIQTAAAAWHHLRGAGYTPRVLSLGGGLPVPYRHPVPHPTAIARTNQRALARHFPDPPAEVWLEPGRYIAAGAGALAATVLARAEPARGRQPRLTLDIGRYQGLPEAPLGIRYPYHVPGQPPARSEGATRHAGWWRHTLHGPLGLADLLDRAAYLPPLQPGDRLYLLQAGAYTVCQAAYAANEAGPRVEVLPPGRTLADIL